MPEIRLEHITKRWGKFYGVDDLNLVIENNAFVTLLGPSGCGKTTTLRMIAGLEDITSGELWIGDKLMNDVEPKDRNIAMVFQNYALYPHMTVYENMAFSLKLKKVPKDEIDRKVREAAEILDITQYLDRKPKALSGGQRQRVAIGRAIVRDPAVFLMDEPLSNLDAKLRNQMRAELIKLRQRIDTTFIYVTHDQTEAMTLGDRIVIMKDGFIQQIGTPQEVFDHPANLFVAGFIGTPQMNFFDARLIKQNGRYAVTLDGITVELADDKQARLSAKDVPEQDIVLGVRPDHIMLCADGVKGKAFKDQVYSDLEAGTATPKFDGKPTRKGYTFTGWSPKVTDTVTKDVTYVAQWKSVKNGKDNIPKTGDSEIVMVLGSVLLFSFCGAAAVSVYDRKRKHF